VGCKGAYEQPNVRITQKVVIYIARCLWFLHVSSSYIIYYVDGYDPQSTEPYL